ncbi:MAG: hypothetical protein B6D36_03230 [Planctomycetes bacterium UTPLA1]|jgi:hypothetical protein|nr:MAG: hypothetical protein B6D36_03230 [Planctomycetes bacterium UTPLA1]
MSEPDVLVKVEGGVADVTIIKPNIVVEVRDFDVEGAPEDDEFMWTDENGDLCWRYFVDSEKEVRHERQ